MPRCLIWRHLTYRTSMTSVSKQNQDYKTVSNKDGCCFVYSHITKKQRIIVVLWEHMHSLLLFFLGQFLNESSLLHGIRGIMGNIQYMLASQPKLVSAKSPSLGCSHGYRVDLSGAGCRKCWSIGRHWLKTSNDCSFSFFSLVICPAGTLSTEGVCTPCPQGTYQEQEGRDFCHKCPRGSSHTGASSVNQCELNAHSNCTQSTTVFTIVSCSKIPWI